MSSWRKSEGDDKEGIVVTLWRPLGAQDPGGVQGPSAGDEDAGEPGGDAPPQWCMARDCLAPLGSRYYELRTVGHDRAACGRPGPGGAAAEAEHTWCIRRTYLCSACYLVTLEREVGAGWRPERAQRPNARKTGRRQGDWDD